MMIMKYLSTAPPYILINIPAGLNRYVFGFNTEQIRKCRKHLPLPVIMQKQVLFDNYGRFLFSAAGLQSSPRPHT